MKKTLSVFIVLSIVFFIGPASAADFILHDHLGVQYDCTLASSYDAGGSVGMVYIYKVVVSLGEEYTSVGWLLRQPEHNDTFKITVPKGFPFNSYTYEGVWQGNGTPVVGVNHNRFCWEGTIYLGPAATGLKMDEYSSPAFQK